MEGLGVHYSTTGGKQVRGHSLLTGLYLLLGRRCPLPPLLYRQRVVAQAEGVRFLSKIDLAEKIIRTFRPVPGTHTHVLVDAWYTCKRLWKVARGRGFAFTGGLKGNRQLRVEESQGRMRLSEYAASLGPGQYQKVIWPAQQAPREVWAHLVPARVRKLGRCQVLIVRESLDAPIQQARYLPRVNGTHPWRRSLAGLLGAGRLRPSSVMSKSCWGPITTRSSRPLHSCASGTWRSVSTSTWTRFGLSLPSSDQTIASPSERRAGTSRPSTGSVSWNGHGIAISKAPLPSRSMLSWQHDPKVQT